MVPALNTNFLCAPVIFYLNYHIMETLYSVK